MAVSLTDLIGRWQDLGIYDVALPFLLVFVIVFGILQKVNLFGEKSKNLNAVVALVAGLVFLQNTFLVFTLQRYLARMSFALVVFLMFLLLIGIFAGKYKGLKNGALTTAFVVSIIVMVWALSSEFFGMPGEDDFFQWWDSIDPVTKTTFWFVVVIILVISFALGGSEKGGEGGFWKGIKGEE